MDYSQGYAYPNRAPENPTYWDSHGCPVGYDYTPQNYFSGNQPYHYESQGWQDYQGISWRHSTMPYHEPHAPPLNVHHSYNSHSDPRYVTPLSHPACTHYSTSNVKDKLSSTLQKIEAHVDHMLHSFETRETCFGNRNHVVHPQPLREVDRQYMESFHDIESVATPTSQVLLGNNSRLKEELDKLLHSSLQVLNSMKQKEHSLNELEQHVEQPLTAFSKREEFSKNDRDSLARTVVCSPGHDDIAEIPLVQLCDVSEIIDEVESETGKEERFNIEHEIVTFPRSPHKEIESVDILASIGVMHDDPVESDVSYYLADDFDAEREVEIGLESQEEIKEVIHIVTEQNESIDPFLLEHIDYSLLVPPPLDLPWSGLEMIEFFDPFSVTSYKIDPFLKSVSLSSEPTMISLHVHTRLGSFDDSLGSNCLDFSLESMLLTWDYQRDSRWRIIEVTLMDRVFMSLCTLIDYPSLHNFTLPQFVPKNFKSTLL